MRTLVVLWIGLAACEHSHVIARPLPELVTVAAPSSSLVVRELLLVPDETMIWDVHVHGITIGRAELVVGVRDVRSKFGTGALVGSFVSIHHELTTVLDRAAARPISVDETSELDGEHAHHTALFDATGYTDQARHQVGHPVHTLHSALGWLRAWAQPGAAPASLWVLHAGVLHRVVLAQPIPEELAATSTLRIDARLDGGIAIQIWLTATSDRAPVRIVATNGTDRIVAELIASGAVAGAQHVSSDGTAAAP